MSQISAEPPTVLRLDLLQNVDRNSQRRKIAIVGLYVSSWVRHNLGSPNIVLSFVSGSIFARKLERDSQNPSRSIAIDYAGKLKRY